ncbi:hypothetical protein CcaverHIS002_0103210 [Cutaneotrichosporon cavernicola]|uniref:RlpA-like protein double-psi beta-barrel domain-containing protein n=1 Tax=Cutaneotrichosporon cavernicola TaxID=279322 RepID=A0AA48I1C0_9TREE|nr:uncharacterized protein CcaverHIS019_0103150 [Cutaneotrichosporon cavernicola]BEI79792.1 hypothetical protein CcaverHIS002_0103210 [Cutaneotrichosporon cavernicola]BEI87597.1 hypothetical protein CcaverHIS019_0103150 [Cutaneotrichosporon cavernicola]BEI95368.1 hypothetical protein CcaverHIS631_0103170 [Cutaneotrichosporon cavernicola]BEJ03142.1 hypothetical protein CcaverHIS641_0103170 [Cutaneotrichosporon cavernicola]
MLFSTLVTPLLALGVSAEPRRRPVANKEHARRALASRNEERTLVKRFGGQATYYDTSVGTLACGGTGNNEAYIVALNSAQYGSGYPGPQCFKTLTITANGVTVSGVQVVDECPTCAYGDLDLSPGLFRRFESQSNGIFRLSWEWDDGKPQPEPTSTWTPEPTSETSSTSTTISSTTSSSTTTASSSTITSSMSLSANTTSTASLNSTLSASLSVSSTASLNATVSITDANPKASAAAASAQTGLVVIAGEGDAEGGVLGEVSQIVARVGYMVVSAALV